MSENLTKTLSQNPAEASGLSINKKMCKISLHKKLYLLSQISKVSYHFECKKGVPSLVEWCL
ncbi:hypothetical protein GCM10010965_07020 [Caldalkalibacillus thermarum]|nr:hypothetical protein GCM10010965_07020 [Caldalkalibacillus thermarum]